MNYKELAKQIASSESPYEEFEKHAGSLDEVNKTTLAREVNKQFFLSRVDNKDSDGDIVFDVINPAIVGTHDTSKAGGEQGVEKTASDEGKLSSIEKRAEIDDSMFVIRPTERYSAKSANNGADSFLMKSAEASIDDAHDKRISDQELSHENGIKAVVTILNENRGMLLDSLSKVASDPSEMRTVISMMIDKGLEDYIDDVVAGSNIQGSHIVKVASADISDSDAEFVSNILDDISEIDEVKKIVKEASSKDEFVKIAMIGIATPVLKALSMAYKTGHGAVKAGIWGAKKSIKHPGSAGLALAAGAIPGETQKYYLRTGQKIGVI